LCRMRSTALPSQTASKRICSSSRCSSQCGSGNSDCTVSRGNSAWLACGLVGCGACAVRARSPSARRPWRTRRAPRRRRASGRKRFLSWARALTRELGQRFGDAAVFLDKDDLRGGSLWRDEVALTLGRQVALLLLLTPDLLGAAGSDGRLRIADLDDPVSRELAAALASGAQVIPVLCDGVDTPPEGDALPPPSNRLREFTWRRLRAYDWRGDVQRIADDLTVLGRVEPSAARCRTLIATAAASSTLVLGAAAWWWRGPAAEPTLAGKWAARWCAANRSA
jgi:hypothetical protein